MLNNSVMLNIVLRHSNNQEMSNLGNVYSPYERSLVSLNPSITFQKPLCTRDQSRDAFKPGMIKLVVVLLSEERACLIDLFTGVSGLKKLIWGIYITS